MRPRTAGEAWTSIRQPSSVKNSESTVARAAFAPGLMAQTDGQIVPTAEVRPLPATTDFRIHLKYGVFDPLQGAPVVPLELSSAADTRLHLVQFDHAFTDGDRAAVRGLGGRLHTPLPHHAVIVRMGAAEAATVAGLEGVRWVGPYHPAYRLEAELLVEQASGQPVPTRRYNMVMADKRRDKAALERRIEAVGGTVTDRHSGGLLMTAELTSAQLIRVARFDEVLWIDRWVPAEEDMNNARIVQGTNHVEALAGYIGTGIRGHIYEGVEYDHPDFTTPMTNVQSGGGAASHGHCTAGCVFGNGTSSSNARGHAPGGIGFYTNRSTVTSGLSRNQVIADVVNVHECLFTTASWGGSRTFSYTSISADADDIVFDHRIPWTQSQSNAGNQDSRPEAWGKNIISVGGVEHHNNADANDDNWATGASIGPAADNRIKPDFANFFESVWTSDRSGGAGYSSGNSYPSFSGTSAATPITAGTNAIAIELFLAGEFGNEPRVPGGTNFQNRPYAQTVKALQVACASLYTVAQGLRYEVGWGYPNIGTMYDRRHLVSIVPEDMPITQGAMHTYPVTVAAGTGPLKICMSYLDPAGNPAAALARINDLNLKAIDPNGVYYWGNRGLQVGNDSLASGSANQVDTVECVMLATPVAGQWTIEITAPTIAQDAHLATTATDATYALVVNGALGMRPLPCARHVPDNAVTGTASAEPFGSAAAATVPTVMGATQSTGPGSTAFFDLLPLTDLLVTGVDLNTNSPVGSPVTVDVYSTAFSYVGNETNPQIWAPQTVGHGIAATVNTPTTIEFAQPVRFPGFAPAGIAIVARDFNHSHTLGPGTQLSFSNVDAACSVGAITTGTFSGTLLANDHPNVTLRYRTDAGAETNQVYQAVVRHGQLGAIPGNITGLSFVPAATGTHYNESLEIRMALLSPGAALDPTFATNLQNSVSVLSAVDHSWLVTGSEWNVIGLQRSFAYDGISDVVVEVRTTGNHSSAAGGFLRGTGSIPRVWASGFPAIAAPNLGTVDDLGLRMRLDFDCAIASEFGTSCGPLRAGHQALPIHGTTFEFTLDGAIPNSGAFLALGFSTRPPYPQDLGVLGFTNCKLWHSIVTPVFKLTSASGTASHPFLLPNTPDFDGVRVLGQWFQPDPSQAGGITASNYTRMVIGRDTP